ncbi:hypothetical protein EYC84_005069 [Monilinia fructicola]|uniref:Uncharacterized protein n=1 Tax=Monilinia fructicola TaxID=38448 RepID=A0A5M9JVE3_MONFR|nr:hypothetical protein EYC84_005069 [Monilinia fructicola]
MYDYASHYVASYMLEIEGFDSASNFQAILSQTKYPSNTSSQNALLSPKSHDSWSSGYWCVAAAPTDFFDVDITFIGGPASYNLTVPADGQTHPTNNALSVSLIRSSNFDVYHLCTFYHDNPATLVNNGGIISVGPPTPITGVIAILPPQGNSWVLAAMDFVQQISVDLSSVSVVSELGTG